MTNFKDTMRGATQEYKANLRKSVSPETYHEVCRVALKILQKLPNDVPLGTMTAALMLAATAYAEGASNADLLIRKQESTGGETGQ